MARREQLTIDDLAATTGVSSRSIRYYQTRGLLPPPTVKGRQGLYDDRHIERLGLIAELQEEGLNLQAIGWLLGGGSRVDSAELRQLKRAVLDGWVSDEPVRMSRKDFGKLTQRRGWDDDDTERAEQLGLISIDDDDDETEGELAILMPSVMAAGAELAEMGLPAQRMLDVLETMREHASAIAELYVAVFDEAVLAPWDARGRPDDEWSAIAESVDRIRPLAGEALLAVFRQTIANHISQIITSGAAPEP